MDGRRLVDEEALARALHSASRPDPDRPGEVVRLCPWYRRPFDECPGTPPGPERHRRDARMLLDEVPDRPRRSAYRMPEGGRV